MLPDLVASAVSPNLSGVDPLVGLSIVRIPTSRHVQAGALSDRGQVRHGLRKISDVRPVVVLGGVSVTLVTESST